MKYWEAVNAALAQEMRRDANIVYFGQDVATPGGPFGATRGLLEEFGARRVRDTPISEATIVGAATGAAMAGLRPVAEVMFSDFLMLASDQLVNNAAKLRFMSGGQFTVPLVVRSMCGIERRSGAQHTQSVDGWFAAVPGLTVVRPSCPSDAAGLLVASIRHDGPVLIIDDLVLWGMREERPAGPAGIDPLPLGRAVVRRHGVDVTIVSWAAGVAKSLKAAAELDGEHGIDAEVIDLRTLAPLDTETIVGSASRTGAMVVVEHSPEPFGPGSQIVASVACNAGGGRAAPVISRVAAAPAPTPYAKSLLDAYYPTASSVAASVRALLEVKASADD